MLFVPVAFVVVEVVVGGFSMVARKETRKKGRPQDEVLKDTVETHTCSFEVTRKQMKRKALKATQIDSSSRALFLSPQSLSSRSRGNGIL